VKRYATVIDRAPGKEHSKEADNAKTFDLKAFPLKKKQPYGQYEAAKRDSLREPSHKHVTQTEEGTHHTEPLSKPRVT